MLHNKISTETFERFGRSMYEISKENLGAIYTKCIETPRGEGGAGARGAASAQLRHGFGTASAQLRHRRRPSCDCRRGSWVGKASTHEYCYWVYMLGYVHCSCACAMYVNGAWNMLKDQHQWRWFYCRCVAQHVCSLRYGDEFTASPGLHTLVVTHQHLLHCQF